MNDQNNLDNQVSAYLHSAAHQPVHWQPWGEAAFRRARELDRPILLDIGAVWCHWCHVMDGESYENPETAKIINEHFIAIKVDRDERPEVDRRYQEAVSAIAGHGGWPLTAFLTPEGEVFFGGTYFPPEDRHGRRGFPDVLLRVADFYHNQRDAARSSALQLTEALVTQIHRAHPGELGADLLDAATARIIGQFDSEYGGFGGAPKFPHSSAIEFLLARHFFTRDETVATAIRRTLTHMARGGIHDQIGGGFHRYSTDARWIVPHFEKMLYDNTELLRNFAMAAASFGDPLLANTAHGITRFLVDVLSDQVNGGFYASQDADVGLHDDGDYFTWTLDEVRSVCTPEETQVLSERFHIYENGEMHHNPSKNVLFVAADIDVIAAKLNEHDERVTTLLASGVAKLIARRHGRTAPFVDRTIYAGWNGMAISACLIAADLLDLPEVEQFCLKTADRVISECLLPDGQLRHGIGLTAPVGLLDDGVFVARALLDAYERTGRTGYLQTSRQITDDLLRRLWDNDGDGFFDQVSETNSIGLLAQPRKPVQDSPTPAPNSVAAELLLRLGDLTGEPNYIQAGEKTLIAFGGMAPALGLFGGAYYLALDRFLRGGSAAVVTGSANDNCANALCRAARSTYRPYMSFLRVTETAKGMESAIPVPLKAILQEDRSLGYFCASQNCAMPTDDPDDLKRIIDTFNR